jgi:hypothetical protein
MARARVAEFVRQFPENGLKFVPEQAGNVRDPLAPAGAPRLNRRDFAQMRALTACAAPT